MKGRKPLVSRVLALSRATDPRDRFVLVVVASHVGSNGCTWVGIETIAEEAGYSRRTVERSLERLAGRGTDPKRLRVPELIVELHGAPLRHLPWQHRPNLYTVRLGDDPQDDPQGTPSPDTHVGSSPVTRDGSEPADSASPVTPDGSSPVREVTSPVRNGRVVPAPVAEELQGNHHLEPQEEPPPCRRRESAADAHVEAVSITDSTAMAAARAALIPGKAEGTADCATPHPQPTTEPAEGHR